MNRRSKIVGRLLDIACVLCILLVTGVFLQRRYFPLSQEGQSSSLLKKGAPISLSGVVWPESKATLVMALSTNCHYCKESSPFYRSLIAANANRFHTIAVFPQSASDARGYLASEGVKVDDARQARFDALGVTATPTLILVDRTGRIKSSWTGKLSPQAEKEVYESLGVTVAALSQESKPEELPGSAIGVSQDYVLRSAELRRVLAGSQSMPIVDTRPREEFAKVHFKDSLNIPIDELEMRAPHEVPKNAAILIYCTYSLECEQGTAQQGTQSTCSATLKFLKDLGFTRMKIIGDDLSSVERSKIFVPTGGQSN